jgi:hypothetical protein
MESNQWLMECSRLVRRSFRLNSQLQDKDHTSPLQASTTGRSRADLHNKTLQGLDHASHQRTEFATTKVAVYYSPQHLSWPQVFANVTKAIPVCRVAAST